jgi:methionyl-tRNA formyltransferase
MKITLFTSNNLRHVYLINSLLKISKKLNVIIESKTIFPSLNIGQYSQTKIMQDYFKKVNHAQNKLFKNNIILSNNKKLDIIPLSMEDLNLCTKNKIKSFLNSDLYLVFGSSYIKHFLVDYLIKNKTINIHMGLSPYYRGTDCNFWALYDKKPQYVGATIHLLSKGIDSGPILYHALSKPEKNTFFYAMKSVKSAILSLEEKIKDRSLLKIKPQIANRDFEIRYSKKIEFDENVVTEFNKKKIEMNFEFKKEDYINPFII